MKLQGDHVRLSATDLANNLSCRHLTSLDLLAARGEVAPPEWADPSTAVLQELGREHEAAYLDHLRQRGLTVAAPELTDGDSEGAFARTVDAMRAGSDVIYQPTLQFESWFGRADVLLRVETPSDLGAWSYEAVDCKLARNTRAGTILQLSVYSRCIERIQGNRPEYMHVLTPGTGFQPTAFRTADYFAYHDLVAGRLMETVSGDVGHTYPEPSPHCDVCRWWHTCNDRRRLDDHPSFVAGISKSQIRQLREWQVTTLAALAEMPVPLSRTPRVGSVEGLVRVREQARLQLQARQTGKAEYELLPLDGGRGLARLPEPSLGDIFLDLEGDRFAGDCGIEYLFGVAFSEKGDVAYQSKWAFDAEDEKSAFEWAIDSITERIERFPVAHVYHFGHYEPTALKRLMGQYATREDAIDRLLRAEKFVDLHSVARQSLRAGIEEYSLKQLEQFHGFERQTSLREASAGKRAIERALELSIPQRIDKPMMDAVESYNRDDCVSAASLRDWLETLRAERIACGEVDSRPIPKGGDPSESVRDRQQAVQALIEQLSRGVPADPAERSREQHVRWLLAQLLEYYRREDGPSWWELFRLRDLDEDAFAQERNAVAGLRFDGRVGGKDANPVHRYLFPRQEIGFRVGKELVFASQNLASGIGKTKLGVIAAVDPVACTIDIAKNRAARDLHPRAAFVDPTPIPPRAKLDALMDLAAWVIRNGVDVAGPYRAARDILLQLPPRLSGKTTFAAEMKHLDGGEVKTAVAIARLLECSVLPIQGPPGAGKTYTGACMICDLVRLGKRVGVTAHSHRAIGNLLKETVKQSKLLDVNLSCRQKVDEVDESMPSEVRQSTNEQPLADLESGEV